MVSSFIPEATATFSTYRVSEQRQRWIECSSERCSLQTTLPKWRDGLSTIKSCSSGKTLSQTKPSKTECHNPQWKSFMHRPLSTNCERPLETFPGMKAPGSNEIPPKIVKAGKENSFLRHLQLNAEMRACYPTSQKMVSSSTPEATATFSTYRISEQRQR